MSKLVMHRIREVRLCQGLSLQYVARQLKVGLSSAKAQEMGTSDLLLSELHKWQHVLGVPVGELLTECGAGLSPLVADRAKMVRVMKTAATIAEKAKTAPMRRLSENLINQLVEMMPTLDGVTPWHEVGQRRTRDEYGCIVERTVSDDLLRSYPG